MSGFAQQLGERLDAPVTAPLPDWAEALRARGRKRFSAHGLPHRRLEDWKYTPLDIREPPALEEADTAPLGVEGAVHLMLRDGDMKTEPKGLPEGVTVTTLGDALSNDPASLRPLLESLDTEHASRAMAALNEADLGRGLVLDVPDGVDAGCLVLHWRSSGKGDAAKRFVNARVVVRLGAGARLDLVEDHATSGGTNGVNQFFVGPEARLRHARLQDNPPGSWLITRTELHQDRDSLFEQASLDLGTGLARHDLRTRLAEPGASCVTLGAYLPTGSAHVDHHLDVRHEAPGCRSEQTFRGVLHDQGRAVFNGRVHVLPGADDSEAHQSNQNLLLSREAEVDTKPELVIEADEVIASHGATVGQLDEVAVFYLRSRGIAEGRARRMLTGAFCRSVVEAMGLEAARDPFMERLEHHLERTA